MDPVLDLLKEVRQDIKEVRQDVGGLRGIAAAQQVTLDEHIRRTEINEEALELLRGQVEPIRRHVDNLKFLAWVVGGLVGVITGVLALWKGVQGLR